MFQHLQIYDPRERCIVGVADAALAVATRIGRLLPARRVAQQPQRILLLRLERIGDLLMTLDAIADVRRQAPSAEIDLVVGSWNEPIARLIPGPTRVETLDLPWVAREAGGSWGALLRRANAWRTRRYDLALNFEGDLRSHLLMALSGAPRRVGFSMAGGGPLLTTIVSHDPRLHTATNAARIVEAAFGSSTPRTPSGRALRIPDAYNREADALLARKASAAGIARDALVMPLIGIHPGGGREIKQWDTARFAEVAARLAAHTGGAIVVTGSAGDRPIADSFLSCLKTYGVRAIDLVGDANLLILASILERLQLFVTGDTGPMHLAAALGTPLVAIFGPSDPARYAPLTPHSRVVRIDLPCAPCNRIRLPPRRCVGHIPDCLSGIVTARVIEAAESLLDEMASVPAVRRTDLS